MPVERGSTLHAAYIKEQLAAQEVRKASIEQRGAGVITTSGVLVSLLFGLAAILTGAENYQLPGHAKSWLLAAMISFVVAALAAIVTSAPLFYSGPKIRDLEEAIKGPVWQESPADAEKRIAATEIKVLATARSRNTFKGYALLLAILTQVCALVFLAIAISVILDNG